MDTSAFYVHREDYERVGRESAAGTAQGLTYTTEVEFKRKNGGRFWAVLRGRAIDPKDLSAGVIWMLMDVTERKKAEQAVARSQAELAAIYDSSPMMMCLVNSQHQVERMNRAMNEFHGGSWPVRIRPAPGDILGCVDALENPQGCGSGKSLRELPLAPGHPQDLRDRPALPPGGKQNGAGPR